jgi:hypothetical protein
MIMDENVKKAVEAADQACATYRLGFEGRRHWQTIRQALRDQEAEIAGNDAENAELIRALDMCRIRAEKAEALLRETLRYLDPRHYSEIIKRITAHLGGEQ